MVWLEARGNTSTIYQLDMNQTYTIFRIRFNPNPFESHVAC